MAEIVHDSPYLLVFAQNAPETKFELVEGKTFTLGRLSENDLCILDGASSRRHCKIECKDGQFFLTDLASSNGTSLNGIMIEKAFLQDQDFIQIGQTQLQFIHPQRPRNEPLLLNAAKVPSEDFLEKSLANYQPEGASSGLFPLFFQLGKILVSNQGSNRKFQNALRLICTHLGSERGFLAVKQQDSPGLKTLACHYSDPVLELAVPIIPSRSIVERTMDMGETILIEDAVVDQRFSLEESIQSQTIRSALCCPLRVDQESIGILYVDHLSKKKIFNEPQVQLLQAISYLLTSNLEQEVEVPGSSSWITDQAAVVFGSISNWEAVFQSHTPNDISMIFPQANTILQKVVQQHRGDILSLTPQKWIVLFRAKKFKNLSAATHQAIDFAYSIRKECSHFSKQFSFNPPLALQCLIDCGPIQGMDHHPPNLPWLFGGPLEQDPITKLESDIILSEKAQHENQVHEVDPLNTSTLPPNFTKLGPLFKLRD